MSLISYQVLLFYSYHPIPNPAEHHAWHRQLCERLHLHGRIRIASEGLNGTVSGSVSDLQEYMSAINETGLFPGMQWKISDSPSGHAFSNLRVSLRPNIVNIGAMIELHPGRYLTPDKFHTALLAQDSILIDCRNVYEWKIGRFPGAIRPPGRQFSQFPAQVDALIRQGTVRPGGPRVLMYCTGGIRCEMGSSYLRSRGIDDVAQLHGGIHEYLNRFRDGGLFRGKNFVFDERIALPSGSPEIVGRCDGCDIEFDDYSGRRRCRHCRILLLICDRCANSNPDVFDCGSCQLSPIEAAPALITAS